MRTENLAPANLLRRVYGKAADGPPAILAELYGVTTKRLNEQVKRNADRFPADFAFVLTESEKAEVVANCDHLVRLKFSRGGSAAHHAHPGPAARPARTAQTRNWIPCQRGRRYLPLPQASKGLSRTSAAATGLHPFSISAFQRFSVSAFPLPALLPSAFCTLPSTFPRTPAASLDFDTLVCVAV